MSFGMWDDGDEEAYAAEREREAIAAEDERQEREIRAFELAAEAAREDAWERHGYELARAEDPDGTRRAEEAVAMFWDCIDYPRRRWLPDWLRLRLAARDFRREDEEKLGPLPAQDGTEARA